ncbi:hypothetical protein MNBD_BACTEROID01-922 [hydrothermal vent metagenome]|uniref:Uncharacterized protein n=1 Tax=hydrothermal vent metagenome TaxID=652676 RepID=A0A3B0TP26_9ZZZZ
MGIFQIFVVIFTKKKWSIGRMRRLVILLFIVNLSIAVNAQGLMELPLPPIDTTGPEAIDIGREMMPGQALFSNTLLNKGLFSRELTLPESDFNNLNAGRWQIDYSGLLNQGNQFNSPGYFTTINPFIRSGIIFNQAKYKISENFTLGGNSFGANSIFSAPLPNRGNTNFDYRGASMFMQYKISKNVKIETRVSVTNSPHPYP